MYLGATGTVGQRFLQLLSGHPWFEVTALAASGRSAASATPKPVTGCCPRRCRSSVAGLVVQPIEPGLDCQLVFSALPSSVAGPVEEDFAQAGYAVCSNAAAHRMDADVPLLIPEVNAGHTALIETSAASGLDGPHRRQRQLLDDPAGPGPQASARCLWPAKAVGGHHAGHLRRGLSRRARAGHPGQRRALHRRRRGKGGERIPKAAGAPRGRPGSRRRRSSSAPSATASPSRMGTPNACR